MRTLLILAAILALSGCSSARSDFVKRHDQMLKDMGYDVDGDEVIIIN